MAWLSGLAMLLLVFVGFLLIVIILLQRGRGGGLAGAFGGLGGSSALGTRAGDVFTRITIGMAIVWVLLAAFSGPLLRSTSSSLANERLGGRSGQSEDDPSGLDPAPGEPEGTGLGAGTGTDAKEPAAPADADAGAKDPGDAPALPAPGDADGAKEPPAESATSQEQLPTPRESGKESESN